MKKANANFTFDIFCYCPHCQSQNNYWDNDQIKEALGEDNRAVNCNIEVECIDCEKDFIIENVNF